MFSQSVLLDPDLYEKEYLQHFSQAPGFVDASEVWKEIFYQTTIRVRVDEITLNIVNEMEQSMMESPSGIRHYINITCDEKTGEIYEIGLKYDNLLLVKDSDVNYDRYDVFLNAMYMYLKYSYTIYNTLVGKNIMCVPAIQRDFLMITPYLMNHVSNADQVRELGQKYIQNCVISKESHFQTTVSYYDFNSIVDSQNICGEIFLDFVMISTMLKSGFAIVRYNRENRSLRLLNGEERKEFFQRILIESQRCSRTVYIALVINLVDTGHATILLFDRKKGKMPYSTLKIYDPNGNIDATIDRLSHKYSRDDDAIQLKKAAHNAMFYMANRLRADIIPMDVKCLNTSLIFRNKKCFPTSPFRGYCSHLVKLTACLSLVENISYDDAFERIASLDDYSLIYIVETFIGMGISAEIDLIVKTGRTKTQVLLKSENYQEKPRELQTMRDVWKYIRKGFGVR